jgi:hypothetical protein
MARAAAVPSPARAQILRLKDVLVSEGCATAVVPIGASLGPEAHDVLSDRLAVRKSRETLDRSFDESAASANPSTEPRLT